MHVACPVGLLDVGDREWAGLFERIHYLFGVVGGAVVDNKPMEIRVLPLKAVE